MKKRLSNFLIGAMLFIANCSEVKKNHNVNIDKQVSDLIFSYVKENNINIKTKIIITHWVTTPYERSDIYISNTIFAEYKDLKFAPSYYSILQDGTVVFIYSNLERLIDRNSNEMI